MYWSHKARGNSNVKTLRKRAMAVAVLAGAAAAAVPALADDGYKPDYSYHPSFWQGMYAGLHLGAGEGDLVGGGQIGYNWQAGKIVYGWEADVSLAAIEDGPVDVDWLATARGRVGYLFQPNLLAYATAGVGLYSYDFDNGRFSDDGTEADFVYGLGLEGKFSQATTVRVEYLGFDDGIDVIRAGMNFKLNGY